MDSSSRHAGGVAPPMLPIELPAFMMDKVIQEIEKRRDGYVGELAEFLAIPSVSTDPERAADVRRCAAYCRDALEKIGFSTAEVHETPGHPIVTADWSGAEGAPTVLFYGHYDVQPVDPVELWTTPPFRPRCGTGGSTVAAPPTTKDRSSATGRRGRPTS